MLRARLVVLLAALAAVAGFVVADLRAGGLGYGIALVPVAALAVALGLLGAVLLGAEGAVRLVGGWVLTASSVLVLVLVAVVGWSTQPHPGA